MPPILKPKPRGDLESTIMADIRLALGQETDLVLWRNHRGRVMATDSEGMERFAGVAGLGDGGADLIGLVTIECGVELDGRFRPMTKLNLGIGFALEVKRPCQKAEPHQEQWAKLWRRFGGFACTVHSVEEARGALTRARRGERE